VNATISVKSRGDHHHHHFAIMLHALLPANAGLPILHSLMELSASVHGNVFRSSVTASTEFSYSEERCHILEGYVIKIHYEIRTVKYCSMFGIITDWGCIGNRISLPLTTHKYNSLEH
jgi:hypothetical protein